MTDTNNLAIWDVLSKTDPETTKEFKRAGGFAGTALKPMWVWKRLTEQFGPFGKGWGCKKPDFELVPAGGELLVYCTVQAWHGDKDNELWGVGGDKVVTVFKAGPRADDEAYKKAFTDALMNAFKYVGVGADIHMGMFDDSKYVNAVREEFEDERERKAKGPFPDGPASGISQLKKMSRPVYRDLQACGDADQLAIVVNEHKALLDQIEAGWPEGWSGVDADGNKYEGFGYLATRKFEENT